MYNIYAKPVYVLFNLLFRKVLVEDVDLAC